MLWPFKNSARQTGRFLVKNRVNVVAIFAARALSHKLVASAPRGADSEKCFTGFVADLGSALAGAGAGREASPPAGPQRGHGIAWSPDESAEHVVGEYSLLREVIIEHLTGSHRASEGSIRFIRRYIDEAIWMGCARATEFGRLKGAAIQADLDRSRDQLGRAIEVSKIGFYDWDIPSDHIVFSPQMQSDWGIAANTKLSAVVDFIDPRDRARVEALIEATLKFRVPYHTQYRVRRPDGRIAWIEARGEVTTDQRGQPSHFLGTSLDITERKRTEISLAGETAKLQKMVQVAPVGISLLRGADFIFEIVNPELQANFPDRPLLGQTFLRAFPEFAEQPFFDFIKKVWDSGEAITAREIMATFLNSDGRSESRYYDLSFIRVSDEEGRAYGIYTFSHDVTARVKARLILEKNAGDLETARAQTEVARKNIESLFANSNVAVAFMRGPDHRFIFTNPAHRKILGFNAEGRTLREAQPEAADAGFIEFLDQVYRSGRTIHFGESAHPIGDELCHFDLLYTPSRGADGQIDGVMALAVDISALKRAHAEAALAREEAVRANESKSLFLANMSHEIRTPLGAIIGFAEVLKNPALGDEERAQYLDTVIRNGRGLTRIIDDILDLSKVEAGRVEIENLAFDLHGLLGDFAALMRLRARENGNAFTLEMAADLPIWIVADPTRLKQVLTNAVGNALKFTTKGRVRLSASAEAGFLEFRISDTGRGISPAQSGELFRPFAQADITTTRKFGGTGLGLVLSQRLCRLMGGDYRLESSAIGSGSVFLATIRLTLAEVTPAPVRITTRNPDQTAPADQTLAGVNVLVVEDSVDNQQLIGLILEPRGAIVEVVSDGLVGVSRALDGGFDIVLMDIQMPVMDGHEAVRCLRSAGYRVPIVALTAHAMKEEKVKALKSGFTDFLTKPIQREALIAMVSRLAERGKDRHDDGPPH